jgi:putative SOS response-associated peptidase YedK
MCTAYELGKKRGSTPGYLNPKAVAEILKIKETCIVRPTLSAPVILPDGSLKTMSWGFRRSFAPKVKGNKPVWRTIVNSREDKLGGRTWNEAFTQRRCLIPASSFYEWVEMKGRSVPLQFERPGGEWIWIAGIWEVDAERGECFSMITTEPNSVLEPVHDRMPAVLTDTQIPAFLHGELNEFGPSAVGLQFSEGANFLKPRPSAKETPPTQGELFSD